VGIAASLAAALLAWSWIGQVPSGPVAEGSIFIEDYLRRAVGEDQIRSSDPGEVSRFLARELGITHMPMVSAGLRLAGAEVCLLEGRRGAMIRYEKDGSSVSHYIVPAEGIGERDPAISVREGLAPSIGSSPAVVTWAVSSLEQALVGDLAPEALLALAQEAVKR
jgi:anti-sigma factor RsiW